MRLGKRERKTLRLKQWAEADRAKAIAEAGERTPFYRPAWAIYMSPPAGVKGTVRWDYHGRLAPAISKEQSRLRKVD